MAPSPKATRWQLFRLLGEPSRLRLLAAAAHEELSLGELSTLLEEALPNVSRHASALRQAGLLVERRAGTRTFLRALRSQPPDALVEEALAAGTELCNTEGLLARIPELLRQRNARPARALASTADSSHDAAVDVPPYLSALREIVRGRELAVDVCPAAGQWLGVLAALFERVLALGPLSRPPTQENVQLGELSGLRDLWGRADLVVGAYVADPGRERLAWPTLLRLLKPRGRLVLIEPAAGFDWSREAGAPVARRVASQRDPHGWFVWSCTRSEIDQSAPPQ
ncbi:MAG: metalloregulator ArsR/SmtB family transcription factor [Polyangiaceae bacterium]